MASLPLYARALFAKLLCHEGRSCVCVENPSAQRMQVVACVCCLQAHARLCARSCVTLQDAVMAVLVLDSSMTGSSLMGWSNALHTHFPDDPDAEYEMLERQVGTAAAE